MKRDAPSGSNAGSCCIPNSLHTPADPIAIVREGRGEYIDAHLGGITVSFCTPGSSPSKATKAPIPEYLQLHP